MKDTVLCAALLSAAGSFLSWATPSQARFLQADPVGYQDQFNLYAYVRNDPINAIDPTGRDAIFIVRPNGNVEIRLPIRFYGDAATPANIRAISNSMQSAFTRNIDGADVALRVIPVSVQDIARGEPVYNEVELSSGPLPGAQTTGIHTLKETKLISI